jgi:hypothetical protein
MKNFILISGIFLMSVSLYGQTDASRNRGVKNYLLSGSRHGVSYFPQVTLKNVEYSAGDSLSFDRYHSEEVVLEWMKRWVEKYPGMVELYEVGKSFEGRPVWQMTLTNKKTGPCTEKPAAFFEGGRHSGEVTGTETVMYLADYLLRKYGNDAEITNLLDTKAVYLRPINNPDGHNLYMHTAQSNRSTVRPDDNDRDGLFDEDPPEDLDGDGIILTMRWKDEKKGTMIPDPADSTGRIMKRVPEGKGIYMTASEGIDSDGDGRLNEDGIGDLTFTEIIPRTGAPQVN